MDKTELIKIEKLKKLIISVLSDDLLTPKYRKIKRHSVTEGHCYAASEALYHLLGGKEAEYTPQVASLNENTEKFSHWWIKKENIIINPTAEQFTSINKEPPYKNGKLARFLTKNPSKRTQEIINRINKQKI